MKTAVVLALAASTAAFPALPFWRFAKRQTLSNFNDVDVLNYALTLEHLEDTFYRQGLANFTQAAFASAGFDATFYKNIQTIAAQEKTHVSFLSSALTAAGATPVKECTYNFGVTSVAQFIATASIFEGIGVSAYLGAARQIANKDYLTVAGSILTVEARHTSYIRASLSEAPFPQVQDSPLTPDGVYTMANNFIASCPADNPTFPIKAFPDIAVTSTGTVTAGTVISVKTTTSVLKAADPMAKLYAAFVGPNGPLFTPLVSAGDGINFQVTIPSGVNGQSYLVLCNCNETLTDDTVVAGPTFVEITNPASSS